MTIYAYRCRTCGATEEHDFPFGEHPSELECFTEVRIDDQWMPCPGALKRDYSGVVTHRPMQRHFNTTVGREIGSMKQMREALKSESESYFLRTGIEANFVPHDPMDAKALKVTGDGMDATNRVRRAQGKRVVEVEKML
jgi:hypothetical protein